MDTEISLDGYIKEKIYFNMLWVNIFAVILFVISSIVFGGSFYLIWHKGINLVSINKEMNTQERIIFTLKNIAIILVPFLIGIILHELIHGFFYALFAKNKFKSIKFGIKLKYGVAYCMCTELIKIKHAIICLIMPAIILGFIPAVFSLVSGEFLLLYWGIIFIMSGGGDFLVIL